MTITLPDELRDELERKARAAGFPTVAEYVVSLVSEDEPPGAETDSSDGPPELSPKTRAELEAMLDAGIASGTPIRATPDFWAKRQRALEARATKRKDGST